MIGTEVTMVRIYCSEAQKPLERILNILHDQEKVAGVTAFRGVAGFGGSGKIHAALLLDLSLDLPMIIEFYDRPEKVVAVMEHLNELVEPGHMVSWSATVNMS